MGSPNSFDTIQVALPRPIQRVGLACHAEGLSQEEVVARFAARCLEEQAVRSSLEEGQRVRTLCAELAAQSGRLPEMVAEQLAPWGPFLVELALKVAERVVHVALDRGDYDLGPVVSQLLERARNSVSAREIAVILHPADHDAVLGRLRRLGDELAMDPSVRFETSPAVSKGSCQIRTEAGRLHFDPAEFLEEAGRIVREELCCETERS